MAKKYEVTVDGKTEELSTKKEVTDTLLESVLDGEHHEIVVEQVDPNAKVEEEVVTSTGPGDYMGLAHER